MILDLHGEALVIGIERRALGNGPGFEDAIHLETEVVVQPRGAVALDHEAMTGLLLDLGRRLGRGFKASFTFVLVERHGGIV